MGDAWTDRLSELVDGDLTDTERAEAERHLRHCAECRAIVDGLVAVRRKAGALEDRPPGRDLWPGIAAVIAADARPESVVPLPTASRRVRGRLSFSVPQLAAAAIALIVVSGGTVQLYHRSAAPAEGTVTTTPAVSTPGALPGLLTGVDAERYDQAVAELEHALSAHRSQLDSATVRILEHDLWMIDRAIAEAQEALARDPSDAYVSSHLAETMKQKVRLLRRVATIAAAAS